MKDMPLVNMKLSAAERKGMGASSLATDRPAYPWGLSLSLETDSIKKLKLDADELEVGTSLMLHAKVDVTSVSSHESQEGGSNRSVSLQITDLCVMGDAETDGDAASEKLYDKGGK